MHSGLWLLGAGTAKVLPPQKRAAAEFGNRFNARGIIQAIVSQTVDLEEALVGNFES